MEKMNSNIVRKRNKAEDENISASTNDSEYSHSEDGDKNSDYNLDLDDDDEVVSSFQKIARNLIGSYHLRYGKMLILSIVLLIFGFVFWQKSIEIKHINGNVDSFNVRWVFFGSGVSLLVFMIFSLILYHISYKALQRTEKLNFLFYYINELSEHISLGIIVIAFMITLFVYNFNYCIQNSQGIDIYLGDLLNVLLLCIFMFGMLKIWTKSISMNFNYSIYVERIRKCIIEDIFISFLGKLSERASDNEEAENNHSLFKLPSIKDGDDGPALGNEYFLKTFCNNKSEFEMDLPRRRILLKEFQRISKSNIFRIDIVKDISKLRERSMKKAEKIQSSFLRFPKIRKVSDLEFYFNKKSMYFSLIKHLKISEDYVLNVEGIYKIIEKNYKEKIFLFKNLDQMNTAIDRVSFVFKFIICGIGMIMLYIKVSEKFASTAGVISAIFSTQLISNSFSSNAINSLIFLFFIHPYDIGDRVFIEIDDKVENLVVSELNVFSTVFYRWDGTCVYIPNALLTNKLIANIRRSGIIGESHKIQINARTNQKKLNKLKELVEEFVKSRPEHFTEYIMVNYESIENANKLHMKIYMQYRTNLQNYELYLERKTLFLSFLNRTMQSLEIEYVLPPQRVMLKKIEI